MRFPKQKLADPFDRPNVISHVHDKAHELEGVQPTIPLNKDFPIDVKLEEVKESSLTCSKENKIKDENLLNECLQEVWESGIFLMETMKAIEDAKLLFFKSMQETMSKLVEILWNVW